MFKFPLKRHHHNKNNNNNNQHHHSKSASARSNEGFIFIRCGHNANSSNNSNYINSINNICTNNNPSIANNNNNNNENVAKSTVQSTWRPQLPLPKEVHLSNENIQRNHHHHLQQHQKDDDVDDIQIIESDMERFHLSSNKKDSSLNGSQLSNASHNGSNSKKWSFGRLFRRKKDVESESSSDEDLKAGFVTPQTQKYNRNSNAVIATANTSTPHKKSKSAKTSSSRASKLMGSGFDHIVPSPNSINNTQNSPAMQHVDNEFFLPVETIPAAETQEPYYQNQPHLQLSSAQQQQQQQQQRLHHSQQYLPHAPQTQQQLMSRSAYSLDRRSARAKQRSMPNATTVIKTTGSSSEEEEEIISLNSSTFSKYRSDESIHSGGQGAANGQSRRSRAARNERYYKRLSRDGEVSHGQVPIMYAQQPTQRWKTQPVPLSIYQSPQQQQQAVQQPPQPQMRTPTQNPQYPRLRNTSSLQHMAPYVQWGQTQQQQPKSLQNSVNDSKRSISYDSHIHLQNINGRQQSKPLPPPPPPRDPMRRVNVGGHVQDGSAGDLRPMSYAFDQTGLPVLPTSGLNGRCVSDDKIWAQQPHYQSIHSLNITPNQGTAQQVSHANRRFITRAERDAHPGKKSLPNGIDFHYIADATPRSRKPIHMLDQTTYGEDLNDTPTTGILRTTKSGLPTSPTKVNATEFWKRMEGSSQNVTATPTPIPAPRGRDQQRTAVVDGAIKPRSVSSSRVGELRSYPMPMYSEVYKPKNKPAALKPAVSPTAVVDEVDAVVCGSLHIKPSEDNANNYVEIRNRDMNKAQSMPNHYQRRSGEIPTTPNKYEEYINERREQQHNPLFDVPQPPQRKLSAVPNIPQLSFPRKKPANLEEAINELEAIYRSLGLSEETESKKERVATPSDFEKYALAHADEYDEEDSPAGEPDPIRDDVAYRNIKLANLQHKSAEKQPPFGIPIGPIVPAAQTDYLHVTPKRKELPLYDTKAPDVVKDDLAVRALRKDPQENKDKFQYPTGSLIKKNRATRTQSANIYALIQRDAAKPSGGDLHSYLELTKSFDRSGSMSDIHKNETNNDVPSTLKLLQNLREQDKEQMQLMKPHAHIPFRHPSQGGAICQLPEKLNSTTNVEEIKPHRPIPMPRKSLTPEPQQHNSETHKMEEALNKIAQDAQESSIKLTKELNELRKEAFLTATKAPNKVPNEENERLEKELLEIEKVSEAAKKCGKMLLDNLPDSQESEGDITQKPRKLHKEDKLIEAIDQVSEAANKVCEKILKDIVTTEPPVVVQEAVRVSQQPNDVKPKEASLIMPTLIKNLDPIKSSNIEVIARRCMRQLSDLADNHDYDNLNQPEIAVASTCNMAQVTKDPNTNDLSTSNLTELRKPPKPKQPSTQIEDIDQIMKECEDQVRIQEIKVKQPLMVKQQQIQAPGSSTATASSFSSSSDCLAKSLSPSGSRRFSSSITSFNPYSSSDYIKSPSSDFHAPSTDPIKTFSTTSYDVQSTTSATPNLTTNSAFSYSPSPPPLNLTPVSNCSATIASNTQRGRSSSPSQYNSSEELAMIFGIEEKSKTKKLHNNSGNHNENSNSNQELLPDYENLTNAASPKTNSANSDCNECCAKTNDCLMLLTPHTCSTHTNNASSPSSSVSSSKLETIPELCNDFKSCPQQEGDVVDAVESPVKLSTNFNRIYASKLSIFVDKLLEDQQTHSTPQLLSQFDSLSSLEETSSNPDSGNVSLADFPLQTINNSLQLNSTFNTRFEVRNSFKTEISIETSSECKSKSSKEEQRVVIVEEEEEFPPLPTEEELEESLKENFELAREILRKQDRMREVKALKENFANVKGNHELLGERIILAREVIMAEVKALEKKAFNKENHKKTFERENVLNKEEEKEVVAFKRACELNEEQEVANNMLDEKRVEILEEDKEESFSENYNSLKLVIDDSLDVMEAKVPHRKCSFIMETPQLEMNIMEERINYEININNEDTASEESLPYDQEYTEVPSLQNMALNCYELNKALQEENKKQKLYEEKEEENHKIDLSLQNLTNNCYEFNRATQQENNNEKLCNLQNEQLKKAFKEDTEEELTKPSDENDKSKQQDDLSLSLQKLNSTGDLKANVEVQADNELRLRLWQQNDIERPCTSSKTLTTTATVVNVLGERRQAVNSLTLLEHLVVACTLGLINTDDMFTLCLIIIGIIIVIAIALF